MELQYKVETMEAKLLGVIASSVYRNYSTQKANKYLQVKAEIYFPNINKETMQSIYKVAKYEKAYFDAVEELKQNLFKQRHELPDAKKVLTATTEVQEDEED